MNDMELAEEIERRLGELEITINKATNFRAFGDQFNERLWPTWQEAQVEEERCRREFRLLTKIIAALRRWHEPVLGLARTIPDPLGRTMCTAEATGQLAERPPSVTAPREPTAAMLGEAWALFGLTPVRASEIYKAMLSAAEAEGRKG